MSELFERFTDFHDFLDPRQEELTDIYRALNVLRDTQHNTAVELLAAISELDLSRVLQRYSNRNNSMRNSNTSLRMAIQRINFNRFRAVIGADDYV